MCINIQRHEATLPLYYARAHIPEPPFTFGGNHESCSVQTWFKWQRTYESGALLRMTQSRTATKLVEEIRNAMKWEDSRIQAGADRLALTGLRACNIYGLINPCESQMGKPQMRS